MHLYRLLICFLLGLATLTDLLAQTQPIQVFPTAKLPDAAHLLAASPAQTKGHVLPTEQILDLVQAHNLDSLACGDRCRHTGALGWSLQKLVARYWQLLDPIKHKYVGSSSRTMQVFDGMAKEMDINIFIMPNLPRYIGMVKGGFNAALQVGRSENHFRFDNPPFLAPEELRFNEHGYITVECEVTPPQPGREAFNELVFPMKPGAHQLESHKNFGVSAPSFGMYGVWCMDCNHNCRPEIHPMEWLWWLDFSPDDSLHPHDWQWIATLMRDGTGRFEEWSAAPLQGRIAIPIAIPANCTHYSLRLEALVNDGIQPLKSPQPGTPLTTATHTYTLQEDTDTPTTLTLQLQALPATEHASFHLSHFQKDNTTGTRFGYLHLAIDTERLFAFRLTSGPR